MNRREEKIIGDLTERGLELFSEMRGTERAAETRDEIEAGGFGSAIVARAVDFVFGSTWTRPCLDRKQQCLVTLGILIALSVARVSHPVVWIVAYLISGALPTIVYLIIWLRLPAVGAAEVSPGQNRQVRREGLTLFPAAISNMAMLRVDRLALPAPLVLQEPRALPPAAS